MIAIYGCDSMPHANETQRGCSRRCPGSRRFLSTRAESQAAPPMERQRPHCVALSSRRRYEADPRAGSGAGRRDPRRVRRAHGVLRRNFNPVSRRGGAGGTRAGERPLPPDSVLVSFDDGYLDNYDTRSRSSAPQIPALFFVTTGILTDRTLFWWDHQPARATVHRSRRSAAPDLSRAGEELTSGDAGGRDDCGRAPLQPISKILLGSDSRRFSTGWRPRAGVGWDPSDETRRWRSRDDDLGPGEGLARGRDGHRLPHPQPPGAADAAADAKLDRADRIAGPA